jgi:hypothetical protein
MDMMVIPNRGRIVAVMLALALAGGLLTLALLAKPTQAQGAETQRLAVDFNLDAVDCAGELIHLTGKLNSVFHVHEDAAGGFHINTHFNFADVQGVGPVSGLKYRVPTSASSATFSTSGEGPQVVATEVTISRVIGQGQAPDEQATAVVHFTVHEDGTVTGEVAQFRFECRNGSTASPSATA